MDGSDLQAVVELARKTPGLDLLLLFGSRARGESHPGSDWDFGYLAGPELDSYALLARLVLLLGTDRIDLVNLNRTNGLLRFRVAAEGQTLFESRPGAFEDFWLEVVPFWWDMGPIFQAGYEEILQGLKKP
ncbi:MAG: type VII toxin-antitoxin system MntA family adenylyltransferase antitoxin [Thermoanaerobaculia bacterium]